MQFYPSRNFWHIIWHCCLDFRFFLNLLRSSYIEERRKKSLEVLFVWLLDMFVWDKVDCGRSMKVYSRLGLCWGLKCRVLFCYTFVVLWPLIVYSKYWNKTFLQYFVVVEWFVFWIICSYWLHVLWLLDVTILPQHWHIVRPTYTWFLCWRFTW